MCVGLVIITIGLSTRLWSGSCRSQLTSWWLDLEVNLCSNPWSRNEYCKFWSHLGCLGWKTSIFYPHWYKWFISQYLFWIIWKKVIPVIDAAFPAVKRKPEKVSACTGFEPLTSAILVQRPIDWGNKPPGSRSLNWFVLNPRKDDDEVENTWTSNARTVG